MNHKAQKIFLSGIGGSGMSAIACFLADRGYAVSGSDRSFDQNPSNPLIDILRRKGINIVPQDGNAINREFDLIVFSTAVEQNNPEYKASKSLNLPIMTRPEYLTRIVRNFKTIAIAGTSGKSTAAGLLAFLMDKLGLQPNFIGGGRVKNFKTKINAGNSISGNSNIMVMEACESDGTIVNYHANDAILLNIDLDHHSIEKTRDMFDLFLKNTLNIKVINADDRNIRKMNKYNAITFSIDNLSDYRAENIKYEAFTSTFTLKGTTFNLPIPGKHNIYNALSAIAMLSEMGNPLEEIATALTDFSGIERRFDVYLNSNKHLVIDDYAHNPHKINSLMQTVNKIKKSICYIFQPHGYAPTRMMKNEYIETFASNLRDSDQLILLPILYTGGTVSRDISSHDLAEGIKAKGKKVEVINERESILKRLDEWSNYVIFGARDDTLSDFAKEIAKSLD